MIYTTSLVVCTVFISLFTKLAMATRDSGGTPESRMEQTIEGKNLDDSNADAMAIDESNIEIENATSGDNQSLLDSPPSKPKTGQENSSCDPDDSHTLSKPDEAENKISDNVRLNESESEQKELSCDPDDSHTLSKPDEAENKISDNVRLNESESEQKRTFL